MNKKAVIKARVALGFILLFGAGMVLARAGARENLIADVGLFEFVAADVLVSEPVLQSSFSSEAYLKNVILAQTMTHAQQERPRFVASAECVERLSDFGYLSRNIFLAAPDTRLLQTDIDVREALEKDFLIDTTVDGPLILIFHAHSREMFADSTDDPMTGVMGVGRYLAEILETRHGVPVMHHMERFDIVDGRPLRDGAYERLEPVIKQILADNPSIQVVIDLHRDGVREHVAPMVTYIDGERTAQIMFVNGLSRRYRNGTLSNVYHLPNPYQRENLAFTLNLQLAANGLYPGFARRAYLLPFRYSLHMAPQSILLEVGAQNNTFQEALNAMPPFAEVLAAVVELNRD